jgi:hypothetical protein
MVKMTQEQEQEYLKMLREQVNERIEAKDKDGALFLIQQANNTLGRELSKDEITGISPPLPAASDKKAYAEQQYNEYVLKQELKSFRKQVDVFIRDDDVGGYQTVKKSVEKKIGRELTVNEIAGISKKRLYGVEVFEREIERGGVPKLPPEQEPVTPAAADGGRKPNPFIKSENEQPPEQSEPRAEVAEANEKEIEHNRFYIYRSDFARFFEPLSFEQRGQLITAIFQYQADYSTLPEFEQGSGLAMAFNAIKIRLYSEHERHIASRGGMSQGGKNSAKKRWGGDY